jgi:hypothetical protein
VQVVQPVRSTLRNTDLILIERYPHAVFIVPFGLEFSADVGGLIVMTNLEPNGSQWSDQRSDLFRVGHVGCEFSERLGCVRTAQILEVGLLPVSDRFGNGLPQLVLPTQKRAPSLLFVLAGWKPEFGPDHRHIAPLRPCQRQLAFPA